MLRYSKDTAQTGSHTHTHTHTHTNRHKTDTRADEHITFPHRRAVKKIIIIIQDQYL